jgi:uncharacterized membrane protein
MAEKIVESFEEIAGHDEPLGSEVKYLPLMGPVAVATVLIYLTLTVFLPFIIAGEVAVGGVPLFFTALFFINTLALLLGWGAWIFFIRRSTGKVSWRHTWPLLAVPLSFALFYFLVWALGLRSL